MADQAKLVESQKCVWRVAIGAVAFGDRISGVSVGGDFDEKLERLHPWKMLRYS